MAFFELLPSDVVLDLADDCDGWSIKDPAALVRAGLSQLVADELTRDHDSDFSRGTSTLFNQAGQAVQSLRGVYSLDLLEYLARSVGADLSSVVAIGRGTRAEQLKAAIAAALN